jgi:PAS domain S-box-containing protein
VWEVDAAASRLRCVRTWATSSAAAEFEAVSAGLTLGWGEGLPGRVWETGEPAWITDAPTDRNFPRADAARLAGLRVAFSAPLRSSGSVVGAIEFFARELREPDEALLASMTVLGSQIGEFVARRRAEQELRESESRVRAMLESALDAVVTMDHRGRVMEWNPAAERTFGYAITEALGRDMAGLIVPPSLRDEHRRGFARFLETGVGTMLDRRIEITGMRADGSEFPVELTITRIHTASGGASSATSTTGRSSIWSRSPCCCAGRAPGSPATGRRRPSCSSSRSASSTPPWPSCASWLRASTRPCWPNAGSTPRCAPSPSARPCR